MHKRFFNFLVSIHKNHETSRFEITFLGIKIKFLCKKLLKTPDYSKVLEKIKEKYKNKQKIRVGFYVCENAKWNAEDLYNLLEKSEEFEPVILASVLVRDCKGKDNGKDILQENYEFFNNNSKNVVKVYDEEKREYIPLKKFDLDILFYQQPWGIPEIHNIDCTKDFALSCHFHYGLHIFKSKITDMFFYRKLFTYFITNENEKMDLLKKGYSNLFVIGFPKLDIYKTIKKENVDNKKKTIIYAPHFSYDKKSILKIGTFDKNGEKMLAFAKQHPEYNWVFKPHPVLRHQLSLDNKYGVDYVEKYYSEWEKIGKKYEQGNYFDLFLNSDLMITDCSSFLLEYLPTNAPLFRFERKGSAPLNSFGKKLVQNLYRINNFSSFEKMFDQVIKNDADFMKNQRVEFINNILGENVGSEKIVNRLLSCIRGEDFS